MQGGVSLTRMVVAAAGHDGRDSKTREGEQETFSQLSTGFPIEQYSPRLHKALGCEKKWTSYK